MTVAALVPLVTAALLWPTGEAAAETDPLSIGLAYLDAFKALDQHEVAALALFIGVLFFAVVCAVLLVRTHDRLDAQRARPRPRFRHSTARSTGSTTSCSRSPRWWCVGTTTPLRRSSAILL